MAVISERFDSRPLSAGESPGLELKYSITGTIDEAEAMATLEATAPTSYGTLKRSSLNVDPQGSDVWFGTAKYSPRKEPGDSTYQFDTGGGQIHITQSLDTPHSYAAVGLPHDFRGAINVTHDNVEGVDIFVPEYNFSESHYIAREGVTAEYKAALFCATGKVNDAEWRGFARGEVLFLGARGGLRSSDEDWELTFSFVASPNAVGLIVGGLGPIEKEGHEYLWFRYQDVIDAGAKDIVKRPISAYVEKVYEYADFTTLGIGD